MSEHPSAAHPSSVPQSAAPEPAGHPAPDGHAGHDHASPEHGSPEHAWPEVAEDGFWEDLYAGADTRWSGRANPALVTALESVPPEPAAGRAAPDRTASDRRGRGRAVDLGCGEGADALWLAARGWDTVGVDVSTTAVDRAEAAARAAGIGTDRLRFRTDGVLGLGEEAAFDLVCCSYLHAPSQAKREELLARAGLLVVPGGHLFVLSHLLGDEEAVATPQEQVTALGLERGHWDVIAAAQSPKTAELPGGGTLERLDLSLLLRRR